MPQDSTVQLPEIYKRLNEIVKPNALSSDQLWGNYNELLEFLAQEIKETELRVVEKVFNKFPKAIEKTLYSLNGCGIDPNSHEYKLVAKWLDALKFHLEVLTTQGETHDA